MARRTVFLGAPLRAAVDTRGPKRPSWPDIDSTGAVLDGGVAGIADAKAIALAAATDWDLARVYFSGRPDDPELLVPGRVLFVPRNCKIQRIEPVTLTPSTRLYNAQRALNGLTLPTALPAGVAVTATTPGDPHTQIHNAGAADLSAQVYRWTGTAWEHDAALSFTAGGDLQDGASDWIFLDSDGNLGNIWRPADYSFDGGIYSVADYIEAGLIPGANLGVARVSAFAYDAHGNAGDPTAGTTLRYAQYITGGALSYGGLSTLFFGRLAVDVFDQFPVDELGGHPYRPRLAPARYVTMAAIAVAATPGAPAAPDQPLLTFPITNADSVEFVCRNSGAGDLYVRLVEPMGDDAITGVDGVPNVDPAPADQWLTITPGSSGAIVMNTPRHPLAKLCVGAAAGGTTIAAGATLTVKRQVIE